ncbi:MAG: HAMP domain-containing histidine kinase [Jiangellaceae bacterium]|nr:HAMP domain-containing histidine kinase [Jiangellaceae bacterium]
MSRLRSRLSRLPLHTRVGVLAALGVGVAVLLTALAAYTTVRIQLTRSVDESLLDRARQAVSSPLGDPAELSRIPSDAILAADLRVALLAANNVASSPFGARSAPPLGEPELAVARGMAEESIRTADLGGRSYRVVAVPAGRGSALVLGQPTDTVDRVLGTLGAVSLVAGVAGIGLAAWAGASIARTGLRPVDRLTVAAEHVAQTGRLDPIEVDGDDEIARLTRAFNAMLTALSQARLRQRQLVADAGHELRTPLTSLRTNIDLLAQTDREGGLEPVERSALITDVRAQLEELSALVTDLVDLSREDAPVAQPQRLDLADVVRDALARVRRRAPAVTFSADLRPWLVGGDPQLLGRAVTNLLDNAAKWSPPQSTVYVTLRDGTLEVCDEGPGIAAADLPHVFERFYRSTEARSRPGAGLGLAIVRAAAERHGGTVSAGRAERGGARLTMTLPGTPSGAAPDERPAEGSSPALA